MLIERKSMLSGNVNVMDINVTPESDAPTIPKATIAQLELFFALKKTSLLSSLPVKYDITVNTTK